MVVCPEPGSSNKVTTDFKVWSVAQSAMVSLVAETFYRAYDGTESTGNVTLRGSVEAVYSYFGYTIAENGQKFSLPYKQASRASGLLVQTDGDLELVRGSLLDDATDGYFLSCLLVETT